VPNQPTWEIRRTRFNGCSVWGLFDHTLDRYGDSHQLRFGARKVQWGALFRQVLRELVGTEPVAAIVFRQPYQVPSGYDSQDADLFETRIGSDDLSLEIIRDNGGNRIVEALLGRGGLDPDGVPDFLWFPWNKDKEDCLALSAAILAELQDKEVVDAALSNGTRTLEPNEDWSQKLVESTLAMMLGGHLYLLCCSETDSRIKHTIVRVAAASGILVPRPWPGLKNSDPVATVLKD
jgi:hypothetical protein